MKSMGIFVFYDKDGIVDEYVLYIVKELRTVVNKLIIVVNGDIENDSVKKLSDLANMIYYRKNFGFDGGAYADIIVEKIGEAELCNYDELVLCNDTFYGPFIPFAKLFEDMRAKKIDYWGIDRIERDFLSYIISYLCVFSGQMLKNGDLYNYFRENVYNKLQTIGDVFARFELGLFFYLSKLGYTTDSYTYCEGIKSSFNPDICIKKYGLPVCKKKFFAPDNFSESIYCNFIMSLSNNYHYDKNLINNSVKRKYGLDLEVIVIEKYTQEEPRDCYSVPCIKYEEIVNFLAVNKKIYIFGAGSFGQAIKFIFEKYIEEFVGFIVSDYSKMLGGKCIVFESQNIIADAGIIVALSKKNTDDIKNKLLGIPNSVLWFWK